jgi:hypothetical protein
VGGGIQDLASSIGWVAGKLRARRRTMTKQRAILLMVVILATITLASCGEKETPEQKVERLRYNHEIYPVAAKTLYDAEGQPTLLVDLQVANQGTEALAKLTVLVRVLDATGAEKDRRRVALDMTDVRPGIGARVSATLPGVELLEEDEVMVELETNLPPDVLHGLPEYAEVAGVS